MGMGGISIWQLLIILLIVLLVFGTKRLKNLGGDLGGAIKGFKKAMNEEGADKAKEDLSDSTAQQTIQKNESHTVDEMKKAKSEEK